MIMLGLVDDDALACGYAAPQGLEATPKLGQAPAPEHTGQPYRAQSLRAYSSIAEYIPL